MSEHHRNITPSSLTIRHLNTRGPLRNLTSSQTLLDALCNAGWNLPLEIIHLRSIHRLSKGRGDNIVAQREQLLRHLSSSWVLRVEACDERCRLARRVELCVHASLVEDCHLIGVDVVLNEAASTLGITGSRENTVLDDHLSVNRALCDNLQLCAAKMNVGGVEPAWTEESNSHRRLSTHQGWESLAVCEGKVAAQAALSTVDVEVEEEGLVFGEKRHAIRVGVGERDLSREGEGGVVPLGDGGGCRGGSQREDACGEECCELHDGGLGWLCEGVVEIGCVR